MGRNGENNGGFKLDLLVRLERFEAGLTKANPDHYGVKFPRVSDPDLLRVAKWTLHFVIL